MNAVAKSTLDALRRGDLVGARELRLPGLAAFPREVLGLAETLEVLDLSGGALVSLPNDFGRLRKLRALFCSGNRFDRLPEPLRDCAALSQIGFRATGMREVPGDALPPALRWLTLTDNRIERLPDALGERPRLRKLMLAGNRLDALPATLAKAERLELIRLSANRLEAVPPWLAELPSLAWISWAGNPFEPELAPAAAARVRWADLDVGDFLGEGASGRVYRARWRREGGTPPDVVALKLFKGAMTSDGLPGREMAACLAAGGHPNLTAGLGRLDDHPDGSDGLLMPILPADWRVLANPPRLESCSRDVYDPCLSLTPSAVIGIARGVASAAHHLHGRGLMHGDLYAHNILWDGGAGQATLSDFGAACALPAGKQGDDWRRVEVRAFGLLLGELLDRCALTHAGTERLRALEHACVQPNAGARPLMSDVMREL